VNSLPDANDLVRLIKKAAIDAIEARKPVNVCYGKVINANPLKIVVEQKFILEKSQLVLCRNVTEFTTNITMNWTSERAWNYDGDTILLTHSHDIKGKKQITVHNGLVVGDKVILIRQQGGQKYIVLDRIG
jgi:hypothetical protein